MLTWLTDPVTIVVVLFLTLIALAFGVVRREPWWAIGASIVGVAIFMLAVRWAGEIGNGADMAVVVAATGAGLWTMANERVRARRMQRSA